MLTWQIPGSSLTSLVGEPLPPGSLLRPGRGGLRPGLRAEEKRLRSSLPLGHTPLLRVVLHRRLHGAEEAVQLPRTIWGPLFHRRMAGSRIC